MESERQSENVPLGTWTDVEEQSIQQRLRTSATCCLLHQSIQTTFVGGEPFYKPVIDGKDQELVLRKLMKLVAEL